MMTKTQRRKSVLIAKDVLKQIRFLNVQQGKYLYFNRLGIMKDKNSVGESLQSLLPELLKQKECTVCGLGACFLSHVKLYNKFDIDSGILYSKEVNSDQMFPVLVKSLGPRNMALIESAFETSDRSSNFRVTRVEADILAAVRFGRKHRDCSKRLRAIMLNVIKNDGEFTVKPTVADINNSRCFS